MSGYSRPRQREKERERSDDPLSPAETKKDSENILPGVRDPPRFLGLLAASLQKRRRVVPLDVHKDSLDHL